MTRMNELGEPIGLYDILVAWQGGWLPYRRARSLTGMSTVNDLYEAVANGGVEIRMALLPVEDRAATRAVAAITGGTVETSAVEGSVDGL